MGKQSESICEICGTSDKLTKHHLVPVVKCTGKNSKLKNSEENFIWICDLCHRTIHAYFSENELRDNLNSKEKLFENEKFARYLKWREKHLSFKSNSTKLSKK